MYKITYALCCDHHDVESVSGTFSVFKEAKSFDEAIRMVPTETDNLDGIQRACGLQDSLGRPVTHMPCTTWRLKSIEELFDV